MVISSLRTASFRNLADTETFTESKDIFLIGENGQGKTNFLEAVYFCAYASSFRAAGDSEVSFNGKSFSAGVKLSRSVNEEILVKYEKGGAETGNASGKKEIFINGRRAEDRKELLSIAPTIVYCHEDMDFVNGSPERRRWFFDQTLSLYDPVYLDDFRRYRKVLKSRNAVLREYVLERNVNIEQVLDALDPQLAMYGRKIMEKREKAAAEFSSIFCRLYNDVSGIAGITVKYVCSWKNLPMPCSAATDAEESILSRLKDRRPQDIAAGISLTGPHRDRYLFTINDRDFAGKASTGQRRLLALLLRTAQACCYSRKTGQHPILLLDDVLLEMDGEKRRRFLSVLPPYDQAFFTFLPDEPYLNYKKEDTLVYKVEDGKLLLF